MTTRNCAQLLAVDSKSCVDHMHIIRSTENDITKIRPFEITHLSQLLQRPP